MERPCYRCGANVDDTNAFCPQCNAPQIRVAISAGEAGSQHAPALGEAPEPVEDLREPATGPLPPGTPGELQPPATPMRISGSPAFSQGGAPASSSVDWSQAVPGAA